MNIMVRWRDDREQKWKDERQQELTERLDWAYFQTPGIYRTRQYEISVTDNTPFVLISAEEDVEVLNV